MRAGDHHAKASCCSHGRPLLPPFPPAYHLVRLVWAVFGVLNACFLQLEGVYTTAVGYAGGRTENPTYEEVCSGRTGHSEVVMISYDPQIISLSDLLNASLKSMTQHKAIVKAMMWAHNIVLLSTHAK